MDKLHRNIIHCISFCALAAATVGACVEPTADGRRAGARGAPRGRAGRRGAGPARRASRLHRRDPRHARVRGSGGRSDVPLLLQRLGVRRRVPDHLRRGRVGLGVVLPPVRQHEGDRQDLRRGVVQPHHQDAPVRPAHQRSGVVLFVHLADRQRPVQLVRLRAGLRGPGVDLYVWDNNNQRGACGGSGGSGGSGGATGGGCGVANCQQQ